jgi:hypothetical protein
MEIAIPGWMGLFSEAVPAQSDPSKLMGVGVGVRVSEGVRVGVGVEVFVGVLVGVLLGV